LEAALGRLLCDDDFRRHFFDNAEIAAAQAGFQLTPVELSSLRKIKPRAIDLLASHLDDRVRRAEEPPSSQPGGRLNLVKKT
jgi:hypothetical protein